MKYLGLTKHFLQILLFLAWKYSNPKIFTQRRNLILPILFTYVDKLPVNQPNQKKPALLTLTAIHHISNLNLLFYIATSLKSELWLYVEY